MNIHIIQQHMILHDRAKACLILMESQSDPSEQAYYAAKYAEFMKELCDEGVAYALNNALQFGAVHETLESAASEALHKVGKYNHLHSTDNIFAGPGSDSLHG